MDSIEERENKENFEELEIIELSALQAAGIEPEEKVKPVTSKSPEKKIPVVKKDHSLIFLALLFTLGLIIRLWLMQFEKQVYVDSIHYLLQGENIRNGTWDTWDPNGGRWTVPPLYPVFIAIFRSFTTDLVLAGRLASMVVSLSIIPALYLIGTSFLGKKGGLWSAFIAAVEPLSAQYSIVTYAEPTYIAMIIWSVYFSIKTIKSERKVFPAAMMGIFAALAYMAKAFGLVFAVWGIVVLIYYLRKTKSGFASKYSPVFAYIVVFVVACIPYWSFLTSYLGHFAPDGKSRYEFSRIYAPTVEQERLDPHYEGIITDDFEYSVYSGAPQFGYPEKGTFVKIYIKKYIRKLIEIFIDYPIKQVPPYTNVRLMTPLFLLLLGLGLFAIPLSLIESPSLRILLAWLPLWLFIAPLNFIEIRYYVPIAILLIPIVAAGIVRLQDWLMNTALFRREKSRILITPFIGFLFICYCLPSLTYKATHQADSEVNYNEYYHAGEFMKQLGDKEHKDILESGHMIAFYAGMQGWVTPNTDYNGLINFMLKHNIQYFAMDEYLTMIKHPRPELSPLFRFPPQSTKELEAIYWDDKYPVHRVIIYKLRNLSSSENTESSGDTSPAH